LEHIEDGVEEAATRTETLESSRAKKANLSFNVKEYGATGDGVADDTTEVAAALTAAAVSGGEVYFPAGTYKMTASITVPDRVTLRGAGIGASSLVWATDLGIGAYAVAAGTGGQHLAQQYRELAFLGPRAGFTPTPGVRSCLMDGVQATTWAHMDECFVSGFGANIVVTGDHHKFRNTRSTNGFFNWYWGDNTAVATTGDQEIDGCTADFAAWANVGIHGSNAVVDGHWSSFHLGFAPYGVYKFDALHPTTGLPGTAAALGGGAVASTLGALVACSLDKVQFEEQGNACILDEGTGAGAGSNTLVGTTINLPFHSWGPTYKIGARADDYAIHARVSRSSTIRHGIEGFSPGDIAAYHIPVGGITVEGSGFARMFSPTSSFNEGLRIVSTQYSGFALYAAGTIAQGDILEHSLNANQVQRYIGGYGAAVGAGGRPILGVATHAAATGEVVVVATEGLAYVLSEVVAYGGVYLTPNGGGVMHRAQGVVGWGTEYAHSPEPNPAFGVSITSGGAGGGALLGVRLFGPGGLNDPGFVRPQMVSALPAASAAYRGWILRVEGGAGVADTVSVCRKDAADAYAWVTLI
jgi:hypothetical protein